MTATAHAIVGTFIAVKFVDPIIAFPAAYLSHFALDFVPHWDSGTNHRKKSTRRFLQEAAMDGAIAVSVSTVLYGVVFGQENFVYLYTVLFFALFPDIITVVTRFVLRKKSWVWDWNNVFQSAVNRRLQLPWGIVTQVIAVILLYGLFFLV